MNTTNHLSMTNLLKTIREEKLEQFACILEDKVDEISGKNVSVYILSRPFKKEEGKVV